MRRILVGVCVVLVIGVVGLIVVNSMKQSPREGVVAVSWGLISDDYTNDVFEQLTYPAAQYDERVNKTFIVWQTRNFGRSIIAYDHATYSFGPVVDIGGSRLKNDGHGAASLVIDNDGYIYVFYGMHGSVPLYKKSTRPLDETSWGEEMKVEGILGTYPNPRVTSQGLTLFYRAEDTVHGSALAYRVSPDGIHWNPERVVVAKEGGEWSNYFRIIQDQQGKIHVVWTYHKLPDANKVYEGVRYAVFDPSIDVWSAEGEAISLPIDRAHAETVFENSDVWIWDEQVDSNGNPVVVFGYAQDEMVNIGVRTDSGWRVNRVFSAPWKVLRHYTGALKIDDPSHFRLVATASNLREGILYASSDGGVSWDKGIVIGEDTGREYLSNHHTVANGRSDLEFVLATGNGPAAWGADGVFRHDESLLVEGEGVACKGELDANALRKAYQDHLGFIAWEKARQGTDMDTLFTWCFNLRWDDIRTQIDALP